MKVFRLDNPEKEMNRRKELLGTIQQDSGKIVVLILRKPLSLRILGFTLLIMVRSQSGEARQFGARVGLGKLFRTQEV